MNAPEKEFAGRMAELSAVGRWLPAARVKMGKKAVQARRALMETEKR